MARRGLAWHGTVWQVRLGVSRRGMARLGAAGVAWLGLVGRGGVRPGRYDPVMADWYDWTKAARARDEAIERVDEHADQDWKVEARQAVLHAAAHRAEFTTDYVWWLLDQREVLPPHEPRALGAIMRKAAREGLIQRSDRVVESVRPANHRRPIAVWRSLIYARETTI